MLDAIKVVKQNPFKERINEKSEFANLTGYTLKKYGATWYTVRIEVKDEKVVITKEKEHLNLGEAIDYVGRRFKQFAFKS